jgi:RNA-binding protein Musashi
MGMNMGGGNMGGMGGGGQFSPAGGFAGNSQAMRGASPQGEGSNSGDFARQPPKGPRAQQIQPGRSPVDTRPPPDAPKGPRNTGPGPMRGPPRGGAPRDHPYR